MSEIVRLRARLKNVKKNVTEYNMTVAEAKALLKEIDDILKIKEKPPQVVVNETATTTRIIDGGVF